MILAQANLESVPDSTFKWTVITIFGLILIAASIIGIIVAFRKQQTAIEPNTIAVRKAQKRFNHDLCLTQHADIKRRLDGHDAELNTLWNTVRVEDEDIRKEMRASFGQISRSLGRIEGRLGITLEEK